MAKVGGQRPTVDFRRPIRMRAERLEFRAEEQEFPLPAPVKGFHANSIAHKMEGSLLAVPKRDGEHADETLNRRL